MSASGSSRCLDPGWLFVAAGLTLCVAGVLTPAQQNLREIRAQLRQIEHLRAEGQDGIDAHEQFLQRLRERDPSVIRRLAAAQLNLTPAGSTPVLVASSRQSPAVDWIGRSVTHAGVRAAPPVRTWLTRLTTGTRRLWVLGVGVILVFVGLLVDGRPAPVAATRRSTRAAPRRDTPHADGVGMPDAADEVEWADNGAEEDDAWDKDGDDDDDDEYIDDDDDDDDEDYESEDDEYDSDEYEAIDEDDEEEEDDGDGEWDEDEEDEDWDDSEEDEDEDDHDEDEDNDDR